MSKRTTMDKAQTREKRNRLLASAAAATLSPTEGVREMRAIAGMTQEEFARHREVSARVIKALELGQGNPTVATLNRIGEFFGLEVGFVPLRRRLPAEQLPQPGAASTELAVPLSVEAIQDARDDIMRHLYEAINVMNAQLGSFENLRKMYESGSGAPLRDGQTHEHAPTASPVNNAPPPRKKKAR